MKRAKRPHSQIMLANGRIAHRLAALAGLDPGEHVLEVGPGKGILTRQLLREDVRLTAVEIDPDLCRVLAAKFSTEIEEKKLTLREGDFLTMAPDALVPAGTVVVSNLPYHLSTPMVLKFLDHVDHFRLLLLTLQEEFARRLSAPPGDRGYGALSVFLRCRARARIVLRIKRQHFRPVPAVDSATVLITPLPDGEKTGDYSRDFANFVQLLFSQRRKKIATALSILLKENGGKQALSSRLDALGIDPNLRAEQIAETDLWRLYEATARRRPG